MFRADQGFFSKGCGGKWSGGLARMTGNHPPIGRDEVEARTEIATGKIDLGVTDFNSPSDLFSAASE